MTDITWAFRGTPGLTDDPQLEAGIRRAVGAALAHGGRPGVALALTFVDDAALTALHGEYLDDSSATDVMAFDLGEEGLGPVGELYVSVERAARVAARRGVSVERELTLYVVHGVLHLCGFDDRNPQARAQMRAAEARVMRVLGFEDDAAPHESGLEGET